MFYLYSDMVQDKINTVCGIRSDTKTETKGNFVGECFTYFFVHLFSSDLQKKSLLNNYFQKPYNSVNVIGETFALD